jgi:hypothetical protein
MASACPPSGWEHTACEITQFPGIGPTSPSTGQVANSALGAAGDSVLHEIASAMASAADGLLKTLSTMWMNVNTPDLSTAAAIQKDTKWLTVIVAVISILVAAGQMAIRRRGEPAHVMFAGLARVVVTGASATFLVQTAGNLADQFSSDMMNSTVAHIGSGGWSGIVSTALISSTIAPGDAMTIIIALLIIFSSLIQLMLMILRIGLLVILTGTLPLAAAASMSDWGQTWWRKHLGWLAAWLLYKPAAALLYVSAFILTHGKGLVDVLAGFMILVLSVLILPALLKVIVPATANLGAASGGTLAMAAAGALATGAVRAGLHKPSSPPSKKNSPAPEDDGGPSGAGAVTGGDPPSPSPSSPLERRSSTPPPSGSAGSQSARDPGSGGSGSAQPGAEAPSDSRAGGSRGGKAAVFAAGLAAGIAADSPSWRSRKDTPSDENVPAPGTAEMKRDPETHSDGDPSGTQDHGGDDSPQENGG